MSPSLKKIFGAFLSVFYFVSQVVLCTAAETNIWSDRRKQFAALPLQPSGFSGRILSSQISSLEKNLVSQSSVKPSLASGRLDSIVKRISTAHGSIQNIHDSKRSDNPTVVVIQDVHLNPEAQRNIGSLMFGLTDGNNIKAIGVEGVFEPFNFSGFRAFPNQKILADVASVYLEKNKLGGAAHFGITQPNLKTSLVGIDDKTSYDKNVAAYLASQQAKPSVKKEMTDEVKRVSKEKEQTFSAELKKYDKLVTDYHAGALPFGHFVRNLYSYHNQADLVIEQFLAAYEMESTLDFERVERERKMVFEKLANTLSESELAELLEQSVAYKTGRTRFGDYYGQLETLCREKGISLKNMPAFGDYIRYVMLSDGIKADKLISAVSELERSVGKTLAVSDKEKELLDESHRLRLTSKLIEFELTSKEWDEYKLLGSVPSPRMGEGDERSSRGEGNKRSASLALTLALSPWGEGTQNLKAFENFYTEADTRSDRMVANLLRARGSVLVVGGFHSQLITQLFRERGISYVVVTPKITKVDSASGSAYLSVFSQEKTPLDRLFAGERLFISHSGIAGPGTPAGRQTQRMINSDVAARTVKAGEKLPANAPAQAEQVSTTEFEVTAPGVEPVVVDTAKEPSEGFRVPVKTYVSAALSSVGKVLKSISDSMRMDSMTMGMTSRLYMAKRDDDADKTLSSKEGRAVQDNLAAAGVDEGFLPELSLNLAKLHFDIKERFPKVNFTLRDLMQLSKFIRINSEQLGIGGAVLRGLEFVYRGRLETLEYDSFDILVKGTDDAERFKKLGTRTTPRSKRIGIEQAQKDIAGYAEFLIQNLPAELKSKWDTHLNNLRSNTLKQEILGIYALVPLCALDAKLKEMAGDRLAEIKREVANNTFEQYLVVDVAARSGLNQSLEMEDAKIRLFNRYNLLPEYLEFRRDMPGLYAPIEALKDLFSTETNASILTRSIKELMESLDQQPSIPTIDNTIGTSNDGKRIIGDALLSVRETVANESTQDIPRIKDLDPVNTDNLMANMETVAFAAEGKFALLLEGATALGKSFAIKVVAALRRQPLVAVGMHPALTSYELIGGYHPFGDPEQSDSKSSLRWEDGFLIKAMKQGKWLVLEELNLAPTEVLEVLNLYLVHGKLIVNQGSRRIEYSIENGNIHKDFRLFATMNPIETGGGRGEISEALMDRFIQRKVTLTPEQMQQELTAVAHKRFGLEPGWASSLAKAHMEIAKESEKWRSPLESKEPYNFNFRHLLRLGNRLNRSGWEKLTGAEQQTEIARQLAGVMWEVYGDGLRYPARMNKLFEILNNNFKLKARGITVEQLQNFFPKTFAIAATASSNNSLIPGSEFEIAPIASVQRVQSKIMRSIAMEEKTGKPEHLLLAGPPASSKTSTVYDLYRQLKLPLHYVNLHGSMDFESLVGGFVPTGKKGVFRFEPGPLILAMLNGEAIFLDEMNLSSMPEWFNTVLDEGILYLPGRTEPFRGKKGFRVIAAVNPATTEGRQVMSAPLRSRFHEMWVDEIKDKGELTAIVKFKLGSAYKDSDLANDMVEAHLTLIKTFPKAGYGLRTLLQWADFIRDNQGDLNQTAILKGAELHYGGSLYALQREKITSLFRSEPWTKHGNLFSDQTLIIKEKPTNVSEYLRLLLTNAPDSLKSPIDLMLITWTDPLADNRDAIELMRPILKNDPYLRTLMKNEIVEDRIRHSDLIPIYDQLGLIDDILELIPFIPPRWVFSSDTKNLYLARKQAQTGDLSLLEKFITETADVMLRIRGIVFLGIHQAQHGNPTGAKKTFGRLMDPNILTPNWLSDSVNQNHGDLFMKITNSIPEGVEVVKNIAIYSHSIGLLSRLAADASKKGEKDTSSKLFLEALRRATEWSPIPDKTPDWRQLIEIAFHMAEAGFYDEADYYFTWALRTFDINFDWRHQDAKKAHEKFNVSIISRIADAGIFDKRFLLKADKELNELLQKGYQDHENVVSTWERMAYAHVWRGEYQAAIKIMQTNPYDTDKKTLYTTIDLYTASTVLSDHNDAFLTYIEQTSADLLRPLTKTISQGSAAGQVVDLDSNRLAIGQVILNKRESITDPEIAADIPQLDKLKPVYTRGLVQAMGKVAFAVRGNFMMMFEGISALGKSYAIKMMAAHLKQPLMTVGMHQALTSYEVIGGYRPRITTRTAQEAADRIKQILAEINDQSPSSLNTWRRLENAVQDVAPSISYRGPPEIRKLLTTAIQSPAAHSDFMNALLDLLDGKRSNLVWQDGFFIEAINKDYWLVLEELNMAPTEVTELYNLFLTQKRIVYWRDGKQVEFSYRNGKIKKNFRLFGTQNPESMGGSRTKLSDALLSRIVRWRVDLSQEEQDEEWREILMAKYGFQEGLVEQILLIHNEMLRRRKTWIKGASANEKYEFNLRTLERLAKRLAQWEKKQGKPFAAFESKRQLTLLAAELNETYGDMLRVESQRTEYWEQIMDATLKLSEWGIMQADVNAVYTPKAGEEKLAALEDLKKIYPAELLHPYPLLESRRGTSPETSSLPREGEGQGGGPHMRVYRMGEVDLLIEQGDKKIKSGLLIPDENAALAPIESTLRVQGKMARSLSLLEHILLTGPTGAGKTTQILDLFRQLRKEIYYYNMHGSASIDELMGAHYPTGRPGEYEYRLGLLALAMQSGTPILIDEMNLSDLPEWFNTVLDDGILWLPNGEKIVAKKGFCVIGAMNPPTSDYSGRVIFSPALRSRFREIWVNEITDPKELEQIVEFELRRKIGIKDPSSLAIQLVAIHQKLRETFPKAKFGLRKILNVTSMIKKLSREMGLERSVARGFDLFYKGKLPLEGKEKFDDLTTLEESFIPFWSAPIRELPKDKTSEKTVDSSSGEAKFEAELRIDAAIKQHGIPKSWEQLVNVLHDGLDPSYQALLKWSVQTAGDPNDWKQSFPPLMAPSNIMSPMLGVLVVVSASETLTSIALSFVLERLKQLNPADRFINEVNLARWLFKTGRRDVAWNLIEETRSNVRAGTASDVVSFITMICEMAPDFPEKRLQLLLDAVDLTAYVGHSEEKAKAFATIIQAAKKFGPPAIAVLNKFAEKFDDLSIVDRGALYGMMTQAASVFGDKSESYLDVLWTRSRESRFGETSQMATIAFAYGSIGKKTKGLESLVEARKQAKINEISFGTVAMEFGRAAAIIGPEATSFIDEVYQHYQANKINRFELISMWYSKIGNKQKALKALETFDIARLDSSQFNDLAEAVKLIGEPAAPVLMNWLNTLSPQWLKARLGFEHKAGVYVILEGLAEATPGLGTKSFDVLNKILKASQTENDERNLPLIGIAKALRKMNRKKEADELLWDVLNNIPSINDQEIKAYLLNKISSALYIWGDDSEQFVPKLIELSGTFPTGNNRQNVFMILLQLAIARKEKALPLINYYLIEVGPLFLDSKSFVPIQLMADAIEAVGKAAAPTLAQALKLILPVPVYPQKTYFAILMNASHLLSSNDALLFEALGALEKNIKKPDDETVLEGSAAGRISAVPIKPASERMAKAIEKLGLPEDIDELFEILKLGMDPKVLPEIDLLHKLYNEPDHFVLFGPFRRRIKSYENDQHELRFHILLSISVLATDSDALSDLLVKIIETEKPGEIGSVNKGESAQALKQLRLKYPRENLKLPLEESMPPTNNTTISLSDFTTKVSEFENGSDSSDELLTWFDEVLPGLIDSKNNSLLPFFDVIRQKIELLYDNDSNKILIWFRYIEGLIFINEKAKAVTELRQAISALDMDWEGMSILCLQMAQRLSELIDNHESISLNSIYDRLAGFKTSYSDDVQELLVHLAQTAGIEFERKMTNGVTVKADIETLGQAIDASQQDVTNEGEGAARVAVVLTPEAEDMKKALKELGIPSDWESFLAVLEKGLPPPLVEMFRLSRVAFANFSQPLKAIIMGMYSPFFSNHTELLSLYNNWTDEMKSLPENEILSPIFFEYWIEKSQQEKDEELSYKFLLQALSIYKSLPEDRWFTSSLNRLIEGISTLKSSQKKIQYLTLLFNDRATLARDESYFLGELVKALEFIPELDQGLMLLEDLLMKAENITGTSENKKERYIAELLLSADNIKDPNSRLVFIKKTTRFVRDRPDFVITYPYIDAVATLPEVKTRGELLLDLLPLIPNVSGINMQAKLFARIASKIGDLSEEQIKRAIEYGIESMSKGGDVVTYMEALAPLFMKIQDQSTLSAEYQQALKLANSFDEQTNIQLLTKLIPVILHRENKAAAVKRFNEIYRIILEMELDQFRGPAIMPVIEMALLLDLKDEAERAWELLFKVGVEINETPPARNYHLKGQYFSQLAEATAQSRSKAFIQKKFTKLLNEIDNLKTKSPDSSIQFALSKNKSEGLVGILKAATTIKDASLLCITSSDALDIADEIASETYRIDVIRQILSMIPDLKDADLTEKIISKILTKAKVFSEFYQVEIISALVNLKSEGLVVRDRNQLLDTLLAFARSIHPQSAQHGEAILVIASELLAENRTKEAAALLDEAEDRLKNLEAPEAFLRLSVNFQAIGNSDKAKEALQNAIGQIRPDSLNAINATLLMEEMLKSAQSQTDLKPSLDLLQEVINNPQSEILREGTGAARVVVTENQTDARMRAALDKLGRPTTLAEWLAVLEQGLDPVTQPMLQMAHIMLKEDLQNGEHWIIVILLPLIAPHAALYSLFSAWMLEAYLSEADYEQSGRMVLAFVQSLKGSKSEDSIKTEQLIKALTMIKSNIFRQHHSPVLQSVIEVGAEIKSSENRLRLRNSILEVARELKDPTTIAMATVAWSDTYSQTEVEELILESARRALSEGSNRSRVLELVNVIGQISYVKPSPVMRSLTKSIIKAAQKYVTHDASKIDFLDLTVKKIESSPNFPFTLHILTAMAEDLFIDQDDFASFSLILPILIKSTRLLESHDERAIVFEKIVALVLKANAKEIKIEGIKSIANNIRLIKDSPVALSIIELLEAKLKKDPSRYSLTQIEAMGRIAIAFHSLEKSEHANQLVLEQTIIPITEDPELGNFELFRSRIQVMATLFSIGENKRGMVLFNELLDQLKAKRNEAMSIELLGIFSKALPNLSDPEINQAENGMVALIGMANHPDHTHVLHNTLTPVFEEINKMPNHSLAISMLSRLLTEIKKLDHSIQSSVFNKAFNISLQWAEEPESKILLQQFSDYANGLEESNTRAQSLIELAKTYARFNMPAEVAKSIIEAYAAINQMTPDDEDDYFKYTYLKDALALMSTISDFSIQSDLLTITIEAAFEIEDRFSNNYAVDLLRFSIDAIFKNENITDFMPLLMKIVTESKSKAGETIQTSVYKHLTEHIQSYLDKKLKAGVNLEPALQTLLEEIEKPQTENLNQGKGSEKVSIVMETIKTEQRASQVGTLHIGETSVPILSHGPADNIPDFDELDPVETPSLINMMEMAAMSVRLKKMMVFVGNTALGKSFAIKVLAANKSKNRKPGDYRLHTGTNHPYRSVGIYPTLTTYELLGGYHPMGNSITEGEAGAILKAALARAKQTNDWSPLLKALQKAGQRLKPQAPTAHHPAETPQQFIQRVEATVTRLLKTEASDLAVATAAILTGRESMLVWKDGFLIDAMQKGEWLTLEELNLAPSEVLEVLNYYLVFGKLRVLKEGRWVDITIDPEFHLFATMNPEDYTGRMKIADAFMDRVLEIQVALTDQQMEEELKQIMMVKYGLQAGRSANIVKFHMAFMKQAKAWRGKYASKEPYEYNNRHLMRLGNRITNHVIRFARKSGGITRDQYMRFSSKEKSEWVEKWMQHLRDTDGQGHRNAEWGPRRVIGAEMWEVYGDGIRDSIYRPALFDLMTLATGFRKVGIEDETVFENFFPVEDPKDDVMSYDDLLDYYKSKDLEKMKITPDKKQVAVLWAGGVPLLKGQNGLTPTEEQLAHVPAPSTQIPVVDSTRRIFGKVARSLFRNEHLLLVGGTGVGKTSLLFELFRRLGRPLYYINFHNGVNVEELVGGWHPAGKGQVYVEGLLARAMQAGVPIYIDELNLSDMPEWFTTVMDDGVLWLQNGKKVVARPGFLIIGAINPPRLAGRFVMSPALRSRFREIWVEQITLIDEVAKIILSTLNGLGSMLIGYTGPWLNAIQHTAQVVFKKTRYAMLIPVEGGAVRRWGLEAMQRIQTSLGMSTLGKDERQTLEKFLREEGDFSDVEVRNFMQKAMEVKQRVLSVSRMMGNQQVQVAPNPKDNSWFINMETKIIYYPPGDLISFGIDHIVFRAFHEGSHARYTRVPPGKELTDYFFRTEVNRVLLNSFEDIRIGIAGQAEFEEGDYYVDTAYDVEFPESGMPKHTDRFSKSLLHQAGMEIKQNGNTKREILPHMQFALGLIHYWRHRKVAEWVEDPDALALFEQTKKDFPDLFYKMTLPLTDEAKNTLDAMDLDQQLNKPQQFVDMLKLVKEKTKLDFSEKLMELIKERIMDGYSTLIKKSQEKIEQMIKDGEITMDGQPGSGQGRPLPPELLSEAAKKIMEGNAKSVADEIEGQSDIPQVNEAKRLAKKGEGKAKPQAKSDEDLSRAPSAKDLIEAGLNMKRQRRESMTPYQSYLEPVVDIVDRLRGRLGNYLFPNSRPKDQGWYRSGKTTMRSIRKIMDAEVTDYMNSDLKFFERRILPILRNHRFSLVLDQSGSMNGDIARKAMEALALFMETLEYLTVDYNLIGFSDAASEYKWFADQVAAEDDSGKESPRGKLDEDQRNEVVIDTAMGNASGSTNDKDAIHLATDRLENQRSDRKVMIVITDGQGTNGPIKEEIRRARAAGIRVIAIPIGAEALTYVKENYGEGNYVEMQGLDDLPEALGSVLEDEFMGDSDIAPAVQEYMEQHAITTTGSIPWLVRGVEKITGRAHALWVTQVLETVLFGLVPALTGSPSVFLIAFVLLHLFGRDRMERVHGVRPGLWKVLSIAVAHGLGIWATQSLFVVVVFVVWLAVGGFHLLISEQTSFSADQLIRELEPVMEQRKTEDRLKTDLMHIVQATDLKLGVDQLIPIQRTGSELGDVAEVVSYRIQDFPTQLEKFSSLIRLILTGERTSRVDLFAGSSNGLWRQTATTRSSDVVYHFIDDADSATSVHLAQKTLNELKKRRMPSKVGFVVEKAEDIEPFMAKLKISSSVQVMFFTRKEAGTLHELQSRSVEGGLLQRSDLQTSTFRFIVPKSLEGLLAGFTRGMDLDETRYRFYVMITESMNPVLIEFERNQLNNLNALTNLIRSQA